MDSKKYYSALFIICIAAVVVSFLLLPTSPETGFMFLRDKQYERSYERFRDLYESGDRSRDVVIPMVNLLLEYAQIDHALELMEEYADRHPDSVDTLQYLAKIYKETNHSYEYLRTLEKIYEMQPTVEVLREKERYYGYVGDLESEIEALKTIVSKYRPIDKEYLELTYQYASRGNLKEATETVLHFLNNVPVSTLELPAVTFAIDLLSDQNQSKKALELAESYYRAFPVKDVALDLLYALFQGSQYDQALQFLNQLPESLQRQTPFKTVRVELYLSKELPFIAFELLKQYLQTDMLPSNLSYELINLAIQYQEIEILEAVVAQIGVDTLPTELLMKVILTASLNDRDDMITELSTLLNDEQRPGHHAVSLVISLVDTNLSTEEKRLLFSYYPLDDLSDSQLVILAEAASFTGDRSTTSSFLKKLDTLERLNADELGLITELLVKAQLEGFGWELVQKSIDGEDNLNRYERFWLLMAASTGREEQVRQWLKTSEDPNCSLLEDGFYAALVQKHASLSLFLADALYKLRPSPDNKKLLAEALLLNGRAEESFNLLRELLRTRPDVAELYVNALTVLSAEKPEYTERLERAVDEFMQFDMLSKPALRNLGYLMLDHQKRVQAATVFAQLAKGESVDAPDMDTLLWIWGKDLSDDQQQWVLAHAMAADGDEKAKWLQYFMNIENPELAIQTVIEEDLQHEAIADKYLEALAVAKQEEKFRDVIAYLIPQESRLPRLKKLGKLAYDEGLRTIAESAFVRILEQDPDDQETIRSLGYIVYFQGDYSRALPLLQRVDHQLLAYLYIGEIFQIKGWVGLANSYYHCAYRAYCELEDPSDDQRAVYATVLYRLGYFCEALGIYEQLLIKGAENQYWIADYANMLIDLGYLDKARCVLWQPLNELPNESLQLTRIRYFSTNLCYMQALSLTNELVSQYPESGQAQASKASIEWTLKRWRKAFCSIQKARALEPKNELYCLTQREILRTHRPETMATFEYRVTGTDQYERYGYFSYRHPINAANLLFTRLDTDNIDVEDYVNTTTGVLEDREARRFKAEVSWIHRLWYGGALTSSIYFNGDGAGAGLLFLHPDLYGSTLFSLEYHRPNWDFTQTIIEDGNRDMVAFKRVQPLLPRFEVSFGAGLNRYNLDNLSNAASSWSLEGGATYLLSKGNPISCLMGKEGVVSLNYYLDAEYRIEEKERLGPFDQPFSPLPLVSRETHAGFVYLSKRFGKCLSADGFGGISYDREAGGNVVPIWGSQIHFGDLDSFHGRLEYSHSTSTEFSTESVDRYLIDLRWLW